MKHRRKAKKRKTCIFLAIAIIIVVIIISGFHNQPSTNQPVNSTSSESKAAIVDQLSLTFPNPTFRETATNILKQAGYVVDYYPGEEVTVEFYRNLATHSYHLIVLRIHSGLFKGRNPPLALFTSELYSTEEYAIEQLTGQICPVHFNATLYEDNRTYFGIMPEFIKQSMNGKFNNSIIIMMGCDGLARDKDIIYYGMAQAFIEKGAKVYFGWEGPVSVSHTDLTTTRLLQHLITERKTVHQAWNQTFEEVGFDPTYNSEILYYPREAGIAKLSDG